MREIIEVKSEWLMEVAPHYYKNIDLLDNTNSKKFPKNIGTAQMKV